MKLAWSFASCVVALAACSVSSDDTGSSTAEINGVPVGEVRGVVDISNTLRSRIFDDSDTTTQSFDISRLAGDPLFALRSQLGTFAQVGSSMEYQGGLPTPFSLTLWHQVMARFADSMGARCNGPATISFPQYTKAGLGMGTTPGITFQVAPPVAAKIDAVCVQATPESVIALFDVVMGRGGTLAAERAAFADEFAKPEYAAMTPPQRVSSIVLAMLLNPYFLLQN